MKKRIILALIVLSLLCSILPVAMATEDGDQTVLGAGSCGENLTWELKDGVLTIIGYGRMDDFPDNAPWADDRDEIISVIFTGDVTYIGERAFWDCDNLIHVEFGDKLTELGKQAFISCDALEVLYFPATFKIFGEGSLQSCPSLKALYCAGRFPSFKLNCLWDTYLTIYYSAAQPWSESTIADLEAAFKGRVSFEPADNVLPPEPTEPTEPTEPVTEPTEPETEPTEEVTEATEEVTVPATEETTVETEATEEATEAPTEAPTQAPSEPPRTEPEPAPEQKSGSWIGLVIIASVLLIMAVGSLIFGRKGKYSR